ncbi:hypothetical protein HK101_001054 [Irineochytrium annulatum]|nr:hypothetical protein HK101_001054 [Irineochytrium annulatum]
MAGGVDSYAVYQVAPVDPYKEPLNDFFHPYAGQFHGYCYKDRTAHSFTVADFPAWLARDREAQMTFATCTGACSTAGYKFAGLENGQAPIVAMSNCNVPCAGDPHMSCGGAGYLSVLWKGNPSA